MDQSVQTGATHDALANDLRRALVRALAERGDVARAIYMACPTKLLSTTRARLAGGLAAERGADFAWGHCDARVDSSPALAPLAQALAPVLDRRLRGSAPALRALLRRRAGALTSLFPVLFAFHDAETDDARTQVTPTEALIELLATLTAKAPLVLVLSRSDHAAPALVELLVACTRAPLGRLVLLVLARHPPTGGDRLAPLRERAQLLDERAGECRPSPQLIETFSQLVGGVREHFVLLDHEWTIWFINYTLPELSPRELVGRSLLDFTMPEQREMIAAHLERVRQTGRPSRFESELLGHWFENLCTAVHQPGRPTDTCAYLLRAIDITERRRTEQALADKMHALELAERLLDSGSWEWNFKTNVKTVTDGMLRLYQLKREEWTGDPNATTALMHPDDREMVAAAKRALIESDETRHALDFRILLPTGELRHIHAECVVIRDDEGVPVRSLGTHRDVTARVEAERTREALIGELREKNAELERFNYIVSHDLKSPLVTISGFLGFLEAGLVRGDIEGARAELPPIKRAVKSMAALIADLLSLSRLGKAVGDTVEFELEAIVHEAITLLDGERGATGAEVVITTPLGRVHGDRERLRLVFQNLISNAIKFSAERPQPRVEIGARAGERGLEYFVRDNGVGIDPRFHQRVFGLFERLDNQREGSGVGLALVRRIVELHRGRVWIESTGEGAGATVCFTLGRPRA